jgi:hypothetical protein
MKDNLTTFSRFKNFLIRNVAPIPTQLGTRIGLFGNSISEQRTISPLIAKDSLEYAFTFLDAKDLMKIQSVNKHW